MQIILLSFYECSSVMGYHEVVGIPKHSHMLKNLFEFIALKGGCRGKNWASVLVPTVSTCTHAHEPPGETFST